MTRIIDIVAPSGSLKNEPEVWPKTREFLAAQGLVARIPDNILGEDLLSANKEEVRVALLKQTLYAEDSDFIWAARGGYGATPVLAHLQGLPAPKKKKTLVGFSDITALHLFLTQQWGWETIHGCSMRQLVVRDNLDDESLARSEALLHDQLHLQETLVPLNETAKTATLITGALTGGNLKLVEASLATFWQIDAKNKILLLEDHNEADYRVDRILVHLEQAQIFAGVKAIIFGDFSYVTHPEQEKNIQEVLAQFAQKQAVPVFKGPFFGHGRVNYPWRYGLAKIDNCQLIQ